MLLQKRLKKAALLNNGKFFFLDKFVIRHLASEDSNLGWRLLKLISSKTNGGEIIRQFHTPPWGAPYLLRRYPFLSPTALTHIVNLLSIKEAFPEEEINSFFDFGGGYGGFASCVLTTIKEAYVSIFDIEEMLIVQNQYISSCYPKYINQVSFYDNLEKISNSEFDIFNASFSFSEVPIEDRKTIEKFIYERCKRIFIIFQEEWKDNNNIDYMKSLLHTLIEKGWHAEIRPYEEYGWKSINVLVGKKITNRPHRSLYV